MSCSGNGVEPARGDKPYGRRPKPGVTPKAGNTTTVPPSRLLTPASGVLGPHFGLTWDDGGWTRVYVAAAGGVARARIVTTRM